LPRIGLLSDSHGRASTTCRAVQLLLEQDVDLLIHLGDVGTVEVIDALAVHRPGEDQQIPAHLVFGNTDWDIQTLDDYAQELHIQVDHPVGRLTWGATTLVFCHGHQNQPMEDALNEKATYLCHGHTHCAADTRQGATRILNPGALFRAQAYTVAVLDTDADAVTFHTVNDH